MLNPQDRDAIESLFDRIETTAAKSGPRDADAEVLIQQRLRNAPASPYYMAQTILVQEQAMRMAEQKIADLEAQVARRPAGGGLFGGLFGDGDAQRDPPRELQQGRRQPRGPWDRGNDDGYDNRQRGGGGFLAGAAQTALGGTTGVLLGSAIAGMMTGGANAQELNPDAPPADDQAADTGADQGQDFDTGGDDDFDMGGEF